MQICLNSLRARFSNRILVWKYIIWVTLYLVFYNPLWVGNCLHGQVLPRIRDTLPCLFCSNSNVSKQQLMRIPETLGFHGGWTVPQYIWTKISTGEKAQWSLRLSIPPCKLTNIILLYSQGEICTVQEVESSWDLWNLYFQVTICYYKNIIVCFIK